MQFTLATSGASIGGGGCESSMGGEFGEEFSGGGVCNLKNFDHNVDKSGAADCFRSMEFDSNLHKFDRPADPDQESDQYRFDMFERADSAPQNQ